VVRIPNRYRPALSLPVALLLLFACSEINQPVQPTHFISSHWFPDTTEYTIAFFGPDHIVCTTDTSEVVFLGRDTPTLRFFVKTGIDFSQRFPALDFSNSGFVYEAFIVDSSYVSFFGDTLLLPHSRIHLVRLSGPGSPDTVPVSSRFLDSRQIIDIDFSDSLVGYPERFLWQAYFYQPRNTLPMPPEPYGYIVDQ
jgi:hypothetical protein